MTHQISIVSNSTAKQKRTSEEVLFSLEVGFDYLLTASERAFPALNLAVFLAAILISLPV